MEAAACPTMLIDEKSNEELYLLPLQVVKHILQVVKHILPRWIEVE